MVRETNTDQTGDEALVRPLYRSGNSTVVTIPPRVLEASGLAEGDGVAVTVDGSTIVLRPTGGERRDGTG
jgi:antitoxin component of MazEF toxin-antitoxin module